MSLGGSPIGKNHKEVIAMKNSIMILITGLLLLWTSANTINAQSSKGNLTDKYYWLDLGLGRSTVDEGGGFHMGATYQFGRNMLSLRATLNGELFGKTIGDYGLLYGYALASSRILSSFGVGISLVSGSISKGLFSEEEAETIGPTIGLPLEAQLVWRPLKFMGIGLHGYANINPEESFTGATLCIHIGKLR
jgi:hypothetical protein